MCKPRALGFKTTVRVPLKSPDRRPDPEWPSLHAAAEAARASRAAQEARPRGTVEYRHRRRPGTRRSAWASVAESPERVLCGGYLVTSGEALGFSLRSATLHVDDLP